MGFEAHKSPVGRSSPSTEERITGIEEARQRIHELFEKGERPIVSVPEEYVNALVQGSTRALHLDPRF